MTERSKRIPSLVLPVCGLGLATFFTMAMATAGAAALWVVLFGLLMGAVASQIFQLELKCYLGAQSEESDGLSGRIRLAFVTGVSLRDRRHDCHRCVGRGRWSPSVVFHARPLDGWARQQGRSPGPEERDERRIGVGGGG